MMEYTKATFEVFNAINGVLILLGFLIMGIGLKSHNVIGIGAKIVVFCFINFVLIWVANKALWPVIAVYTVAFGTICYWMAFRNNKSQIENAGQVKSDFKRSA